MPIRKYLGDNCSFAPDDLDAMGRAFTAALAKLGLNDRSDAMVEMVARRIVRAALNGERSVIALSEIGAGAGSEPGDAGVIVIAQTDRTSRDRTRPARQRIYYGGASREHVPQVIPK